RGERRSGRRHRRPGRAVRLHARCSGARHDAGGTQSRWLPQRRRHRRGSALVRDRGTATPAHPDRARGRVPLPRGGPRRAREVRGAMKRSAFSTSLLLLLALLAACGPAAPPPPSTVGSVSAPTPPAAPKRLTIALEGEPGNLI